MLIIKKINEYSFFYIRSKNMIMIMRELEVYLKDGGMLGLKAINDEEMDWVKLGCWCMIYKASRVP